MGTPTLAQGAVTPQNSRTDLAARDGGRVGSLLFALAAAWAAAGSLGLLGHTLRHALTLTLLGACVVTGMTFLRPAFSWRRGLVLAFTCVVAVLISGSPHAVNVMASALVLGCLACLRPASGNARLFGAAASVFVLGAYRFAVTTFPWFWLLTDRLAAGITSVPGFISGQPLHTGATFAGLDYLVSMLALGGFWVLRAPGPRGKRLWQMLALVGGAHLLYLLVLCFGPKILTLLPAAQAATETTFGQKTPWDWASAVRSLIPWNLPAIAFVLHLTVAGWILKRVPADANDEAPEARTTTTTVFHLPRLAVPALIIGLALAVPPLSMLSPQRLSLSGKKIVVYEKGFLNWLKPKHGEYGRLSVGMYGMLPEFLQSYGAQCVVSPDLSPSDLQGANLLVLIFPNKPWNDGQLDRIWSFVREGGSLLVLGEHTVREKEGGSRFNDVLQPTAMRIAFDSSMFEIGGWLESYEALSHPATAGLTDYRNDFGVVIGASVEARWPARPVLIGRHGFSDLGDVTNDESKGGSMMGNHKYDAGEKLGDQLLAAEQRFGRGRVMAFGDTSGFSNSILFGSHDFTSRLYAYLCNDAAMSPGRGLAGGLGLALLVALILLARMRPGLLALTAMAFSGALAWTINKNHDAASVLPDGRTTTPNRLAYLDTSHLERSSRESWRETGLGGLEMTLMRNGYLVLSLQDFDQARLERAGLFISVAPSRPFAANEIIAVRQFVENGGIFICTAGWPESGASRRLLADLGFYVGGIGAATSGQPEPKSFGHFKAPYYNGGDYMAYVRFHAAWPVESSDSQARPIAYGPRDPKGPPEQADPSVILMRRIGRGKVVVVADSEFATNKNLEREGGQPVEGMRENADFWRWLLDYLNDRQPYVPPKPLPTPPAQPAEKSERDAP